MLASSYFRKVRKSSLSCPIDCEARLEKVPAGSLGSQQQYLPERGDCQPADRVKPSKVGPAVAPPNPAPSIVREGTHTQGFQVGRKKGCPHVPHPAGGLYPPSLTGPFHALAEFGSPEGALKSRPPLKQGARQVPVLEAGGLPLNTAQEAQPGMTHFT